MSQREWGATPPSQDPVTLVPLMARERSARTCGADPRIRPDGLLPGRVPAAGCRSIRCVRRGFLAPRCAAVPSAAGRNPGCTRASNAELSVRCADLSGWVWRRAPASAVTLPDGPTGNRRPSRASPRRAERSYGGDPSRTESRRPRRASPSARPCRRCSSGTSGR